MKCLPQVWCLVALVFFLVITSALRLAGMRERKVVRERKRWSNGQRAREMGGDKIRERLSERE